MNNFKYIILKQQLQKELWLVGSMSKAVKKVMNISQDLFFGEIYNVTMEILTERKNSQKEIEAFLHSIGKGEYYG